MKERQANRGARERRPSQGHVRFFLGLGLVLLVGTWLVQLGNSAFNRVMDTVHPKHFNTPWTGPWDGYGGLKGGGLFVYAVLVDDGNGHVSGQSIVKSYLCEGKLTTSTRTDAKLVLQEIITKNPQNRCANATWTFERTNEDKAVFTYASSGGSPLTGEIVRLQAPLSTTVN
jgi:hypothetical protein